MSEIPADVLEAANAAFKRDELDNTLLGIVARAILAERERHQWQPIVTAPIDGTRILAAEPDGDGWIIGIAVFCKTPHVPIYCFHFTEGDPEDMDLAHPTHWMALPKPPSALTDEAKARRSKALDELGALDGEMI